METRRLGKTDIDAAVVGFGGMAMGYQHISLGAAKILLNEALDTGINIIDTAECYSTSEELIGEAIGRRRKEFYLFTKCGHESGWNYPDWRPESLLRSIERSLKRLKTNYVDVVQLHSCSETELRQGSAIETLQRVRERGDARYIGYSGDGQAALYAVECGAFDTLQISVNIADQGALEAILPAAATAGMGIIAKRPLANVVWHHSERSPRDSYGRVYWDRLQKLNYDFLRRSLRETVSIALRFTLGVPGVHTAVVGTIQPARFADNAAIAAAGPLPEQQFESIRARWREVARPSWTGQS